ncbi:biofilm regulation phosphoprotein SiaC [Orrella dioscoreae]|uniref:FIG057251: Fe-S oxidoreductase n=1 Tax=Orrella dioscoreae TaxID=1851544 RepID=A0A1C3K489_9BURK|nr:biofilm regulation phosphoprotein SiaC [Orrella dioscoreae]SBT26310.1 FIG057251: Fe-S oxidoreductase [Orrella dioscoreae]SOE47115.1 FIG057251: Fe-S oxidoreductase [Orrella dioscoreae]
MNDLNISATQSTPSVSADFERGILHMRGDSYPENSFELFGPVIRWVEEYLGSTDKPLRLELELLYLNTSSVKAMMDILDLVEEAYRAKRDVSLRWVYDQQNERVAELAEEFKEDCSFPFEITSR